MKKLTLPGTDITAPNVVLGLMRIAEKTDDEVRELVGTARDAGNDFVDHADIYGGSLHACERRFSEAMALAPSEREEYTIQTKCGIVPDGPYFDFSYEHIIESVNGSLEALGTDYVDILLLHRPGALVEPDEVARLRRARESREGARVRRLESHADADRAAAPQRVARRPE
ncbi:Aldo/keto reductase family protein [Paramicrobacterium humi]|uniref:Aldo/keto reductase family protein n=1 Tax=Paramicrobacterium humi TaxID=640635 RepID=A0A1H4T1K6_9MICO|nr:Aldo/keto reductase family protein [Microbacterium humi]